MLPKPPSWLWLTSSVFTSSALSSFTSSCLFSSCSSVAGAGSSWSARGRVLFSIFSFFLLTSLKRSEWVSLPSLRF